MMYYYATSIHTAYEYIVMRPGGVYQRLMLPSTHLWAEIACLLQTFRVNLQSDAIYVIIAEGLESIVTIVTLHSVALVANGVINIQRSAIVLYEVSLTEYEVVRI